MAVHTWIPCSFQRVTKFYGTIGVVQNARSAPLEWHAPLNIQSQFARLIAGRAIFSSCRTVTAFTPIDWQWCRQQTYEVTTGVDREIVYQCLSFDVFVVDSSEKLYSCRLLRKANKFVHRFIRIPFCYALLLRLFLEYNKDICLYSQFMLYFNMIPTSK